MKKSNIRNLLFAVLLISVFVVMASFVSAFVRINEVMYDPLGSDSFDEWVEIFNNDTVPVDLTNATLCGDSLLKGFINHSDGIIYQNTTFILQPSSFALITDGDTGTNVYDNFNVDPNALALHVSGPTMCSSGLSDGEEINITLNTESHSVNYTPYATLFPDTNDGGKTLIFYKGNFTESAFIGGTPGASNDQFAPDFNKWINPSKNNSVVNGLLNISVNITDPTGVSSVLVDIYNNNLTMQQSNDVWNFVWNTKLNLNGLYNITIFFKDTLGFSNRDTLLDIRVNNTNLAPNITSLPKTTTFVNEIYNYDVEAIDPNGDILTFSLTQNPPGMTIDIDTGLITFIPSSLGIFGVNVSVSDGNLTDSQSYNLEIVKEPKLRINDLDVKVDGKTDKNLKDGNKIDEEAKPGSRVQFDLEIENLFTRDEDLEIKDIEVDVTIEDIDDGDDLDEESDEFDLEAGDDENVEIVFNIPLDVDEDDYDVIIIVEGKDENGTNHEISLTLILEVEKEDHEIRIIRTTITPPTVSCDRSIAINAEIINSGSSDEEDVALEILSSELGINSFRNSIDLEEGTNDNRFSETIRSTLDSDKRPGSYPILIKSYYDGKLSETETIYLNIEKCEQGEKAIREDLKPESVTVQVIKPSAIIKDKPSQAKFSILESNGYITLIAILVVIFVGIVIFILGAAFYVLKR